MNDTASFQASKFVPEDHPEECSLLLAIYVPMLLPMEVRLHEQPPREREDEAPLPQYPVVADLRSPIRRALADPA